MRNNAIHFVLLLSLVLAAGCSEAAEPSILQTPPDKIPQHLAVEETRDETSLSDCNSFDPNVTESRANEQEPNEPAKEETSPANTDPNVDELLRSARERSRSLRTFQAEIEYVFRQPLFETETLRSGTLRYLRTEKDARLRIDFLRLVQDGVEQDGYKEQFYLTAEKLLHIDYALEQVRVYRFGKAETEQQIDPFDRLADRFPIVGFSATNTLRKDFNVTLLDETAGQQVSYHTLHLVTKETSPYADDYTQLNCLVDKELLLPKTIYAESPEEDLYEIHLKEPKLNESIDPNNFAPNIPDGFAVEIVEQN